ncbi:MAG: DUF998 domain-containing protein [Blastococcus sp.]
MGRDEPGTQPPARVSAGTTASGLIAAVLGCAFLVQGLTPATLDPLDSLVSELEARDQPGSGFFRLTSLLFGLAVVLFAAGLRRRLPPGPAGVAGCWALAVFGLGSVVDALVPLDCAPSAEERCRRLEATNPLAWFHQGHTYSGVVGLLAFFASLLLLGRHLEGRPGWSRASLFGRAGFLWFGLYSAGVAAMTVLFTPGLGVAQRLQILVCSCWLVVLALSPEGRRDRPATPGVDGGRLRLHHVEPGHHGADER